MKRTLISLIIAAIASLLNCRCTTNNGDIGPLYGHWKLQQILIDGTPEAGYQGDIFWQFQSHVISMRRSDAYHKASQCFGSWIETGDNTLQLNFGHTDGFSPERDYQYTPFAETMLPRGIASLKVITLNDCDFTATYTTADGNVVTYRLTKW